jgi:hypothetical protein
MSQLEFYRLFVQWIANTDERDDMIFYVSKHGDEFKVSIVRDKTDQLHQPPDISFNSIEWDRTFILNKTIQSEYYVQLGCRETSNAIFEISQDSARVFAFPYKLSSNQPLITYPTITFETDLDIVVIKEMSLSIELFHKQKQGIVNIFHGITSYDLIEGNLRSSGQLSRLVLTSPSTSANANITALKQDDSLVCHLDSISIDLDVLYTMITK